MMTNDFSQLPVMTTPRDLKVVISWKSIGKRLALKRPCSFVRDCMDSGPIASMDEFLSTAMNAVADHEYVVVISNDKTICGTVTASDFNDQFRRLAEPFLLVGEVEHGVRRILRGKFTAKELEDAKAPGVDG
jgi:predicted transcriptional regulator